ncbi:MAG TPA: class I SAM-dependent methyltransferase [Solirubrobacteraceae bacterium]|jgi:predicted O-methyltransferase YrrM|nr:class I SAM-dependent methyltransferase [Solirubrobacteraceae bacterium]
MRARLRLLLSLRVLPWRVARFYWRAWRRALKCDDRFSLASAARPAELAELLALARGRRAVVELGTGTAWSALALALDDPARRIVSYDPSVRSERERYLALAPRGARERIELRAEPDSAGPHAGDRPVELLFVDSEHEREPVLAAFAAWRDALAPGASVVFHDYGHPDYPGVREAVRELALDGDELAGVFVWRAPA